MASWSPDGWRIERSLPEGGQAFTYLARRTGGSDEKLYVLKKLKNKELVASMRGKSAEDL